MKLLLDQNISRKLVKELEKIYPDSSHVYLLGLHTDTDEEIWEYARKNAFTIVTQDSDFNERSLIYGFPPKVIWLRTGNTATKHIKQLLEKCNKDILLFEEDKILGSIVIY
jgi:predicted nuclease of predicted toxin-antitoxin system